MQKMAFVACHRKGHKPGAMIDPVILTDLGAATSLVLMQWHPMALAWRAYTSQDVREMSHEKKLALKEELEKQADKLHDQLINDYDQDPEG